MRLVIPSCTAWASTLHQQGMDTTTLADKAMFQKMGVFAGFERSMIRERVNARIACAKAGGTPDFAANYRDPKVGE